MLEAPWRPSSVPWNDQSAGGLSEVKSEHKVLVNILFIGGWGCRARSSYKAEEELSWYMWLKMSCICPKAKCDLELGVGLHALPADLAWPQSPDLLGLRKEGLFPQAERMRLAARSRADNGFSHQQSLFYVG